MMAVQFWFFIKIYLLKNSFYLMCLISSSLESHMSKSVEFFQVHEEDAALHAFLLHLHTLKIKQLVHYVWLGHRINMHGISIKFIF